MYGRFLSHLDSTKKPLNMPWALCWHPDGKRLVISYGFKDCEARLATVDPEEVISMAKRARK